MQSSRFSTFKREQLNGRTGRILLALAAISMFVLSAGAPGAMGG